MFNLKWYYDGNRIFPIASILKNKQVACVRRKMLFTIFKYLFSFQRYSSFQNMQISLVMTSYTQRNFDQIWWKKDISANLYQKCLILCSKSLLNVLHNMSLTVWLPWQHAGFQNSPILKAYPANAASCAWSSKHINMLAQVYGLV